MAREDNVQLQDVCAVIFTPQAGFPAVPSTIGTGIVKIRGASIARAGVGNYLIDIDQGNQIGVTDRAVELPPGETVCRKMLFSAVKNVEAITFNNLVVSGRQTRKQILLFDSAGALTDPAATSISVRFSRLLGIENNAINNPPIQG
jgi:hypothetical protein